MKTILLILFLSLNLLTPVQAQAIKIVDIEVKNEVILRAPTLILVNQDQQLY